MSDKAHMMALGVLNAMVPLNRAKRITYNNNNNNNTKCPAQAEFMWGTLSAVSQRFWTMLHVGFSVRY